MNRLWLDYLNYLFTAAEYDPRAIVQCPSPQQILEDAKEIAREVGMSEAEIEDCMQETSL